MRESLLSFILFFVCNVFAFGQYKSSSATHYYNTGSDDLVGTDASYTKSVSGGEIAWTVNKTGYNAVTLGVMNVQSLSAGTINMSNENRIMKIRIKAVPAAIIEFKLVDDLNKYADYNTPQQYVDNIYQDYTINFPATFRAYSGAGCSPSNLCPVDSTKISKLAITPDPGFNYSGTITIDWFYMGDSVNYYKSSSYTHYYNSGSNSFVSTSGGYAKTVDNGIISWAVSKGNSYTSSSIGILDVPLNAPGTISMAEDARKMKIRMRANPPANVMIQPKDNVGSYADNNAALTSVTSTFADYDITVPYLERVSGGGGCSVSTPCAVDSTKIGSIYFYVNPGTAYTGNFDIDWYYIGDSTIAAASTKHSVTNNLISKIFPNPSSENVNLEISLSSLSNIKITLSDPLGKQIKVIEEGTFSEINKSFDVSSLKKGVYTINYSVDGVISKSDLLLVK